MRKWGLKKKNQDQSDEMTLVAFAKSGDKDAYRKLVEKYQARAFSIAYTVTGSYADAEDVVQESFVKAYLSLVNFKGESSFYTWLYRIVYNLSVDFKRSKARRAQDVEYDEVVANAEIDFEQQGYQYPNIALEAKEEAQQISKALSVLSEEHRAVLLMKDVDGYSYDEIAASLKIQRGTVMSRLFYARKHMQKLLTKMMSIGAKNEDEVSETIAVSSFTYAATVSK